MNPIHSLKISSVLCECYVHCLFLEICNNFFVLSNNYTHVGHVVVFFLHQSFFYSFFSFLNFLSRVSCFLKTSSLTMWIVWYATIYFGFIVVLRYVHGKVWGFFLFFCQAMRFSLLPSFSPHPILQSSPHPFYNCTIFLFIFLVFYIGQYFVCNLIFF